MPATFLALGDSYTVGEGLAACDSWPLQLVGRLRAAGAGIADPEIIAVTGWTTAELAAALAAAACKPPHALVSLLIGANDQYRGASRADYRDCLRGLLERAVALAGMQASRVMLVSIPDWGTTPFARAQGRDPVRESAAIEAFNAEAHAAALAAGAHWVDVTPISRVANVHGELVDDGLHPSAAQYARWVEVLLPAARAALGGR